MAKTGSRIVGIVALVLSLASAGYGAWWFSLGRIKHGLLFAVIFLVLVLFGLIMVRAREKPAEQQK
jgi:hypothetical protein